MNLLQKTFRISAVLALALATVTPAAAWTGPTTAPPGGNTPAPVNVSSTAQTKTGYLGVNGGYSGGAYYPFSVSNGGGSSWTSIFNWPPSSATGYGILVGSSASGYSEFENASGYYALLGYSSYGVYTNGDLRALGNVYGSDIYDSAAGMWMSTVANGGATYSTSQSGYVGAVSGGHMGTLSCASGYHMYGIYYDFGGAGWNDAFYGSMTIYCQRI